MVSATEQQRMGRTGWLAGLRVNLDRPLTSYYLVLGSAALLLGLGLVMVASASSVFAYLTYGNSYAIVERQVVWVAVGLVFAWTASRLPPHAVRKLAYLGLVVVIALLALTYVPRFGVAVNGNRNWLSFGGPVMIQPSELAKLVLVVWAADVLTRKQKLLHQWKHLLVPVVPMAALIIAMVLAGQDLGTSLVLFAIVLVMLYVVGMPLRGFAVLLTGSLAVVGFLAWHSPNRMARITNFLDPFATPLSTGYQAVHAVYAFATGGWWGVGIGASRQKWGSLPEAHTDFIFAVIGEELGLFGTFGVLALFLALAFGGIRIALRTTDLYVRLTTAGIVGWLLSQALVNLGAAIGMLPITGVPLPLVSYGGSAMIPTLVAIGLLVSFARREPGAKAALQASGIFGYRAWRRGARTVRIAARAAGAPRPGGPAVRER